MVNMISYWEYLFRVVAKMQNPTKRRQHEERKKQNNNNNKYTHLHSTDISLLVNEIANRHTKISHNSNNLKKANTLIHTHTHAETKAVIIRFQIF